MARQPNSMAAHDATVERAPGSVRLDSLLIGLCVTLAAVIAIAALFGQRTLPRLIPGPSGVAAVRTSTDVPTALPIVGPRVTYDSAETQVLGAEALLLIDYDWQHRLPDWRVEFLAGDSAVAGYTWTHDHRIEVFVRSGADAPDLARILAHELGHAVDVSFNDPDERTAWLHRRGIADATSWWPGSGTADFQTGAGDFAEVFAVWQVGGGDFRSEVAPLPSSADLEVVARLSGE